MCSKRVLTNSIKYTDLFDRCPKDQLAYLEIVKLRARSYIDRINSNPSELPKINWEHYKANVREDYVKMVEEFEKKYTDFVVPYPENIYKEQLEKLRIEVETELSRYRAESNARIEQYEKQICLILSQLPYDQMTMEDYIDAFPDDAPDYINRPTFWPHTEEEQIPLEKQIPPVKPIPPEKQIPAENKNLKTPNTVFSIFKFLDPEQSPTVIKSNQEKKSEVMIEAMKIKEKMGKRCS